MRKTFKPHPGYVRKTEPEHHRIAMSMRMIDPTEYMAKLYSEYGADLVSLREKQRVLYQKFAPIGQWPQFDDAEGEALYLVIRDIKPRVIVDVGSGCGWSTSWMLAGIHDNGTGRMYSCDIRADAALVNLRASPQWTFFTGDIQDFMVDIPEEVDLILWDTDHDPTLAQWAYDNLFPRLSKTGLGCVHDVYGNPTPAHGEAIGVFKYLNDKGIYPWAVGNQFPVQWAALQEIRRGVGIDPNDMIHMCPINTACFFWADPTRG